MGMGFAPTWLRQLSPPASQNHFNHWVCGLLCGRHSMPRFQQVHGDLNSLWPIGTGAESQPWRGQSSCQFWRFCDFSLSSCEQTCIRLTTFDLWRRHCAWRWCGSSYYIAVLYQVWSSLVFPVRRYGAFSVSASIGLGTLTFNLSTCIWGHGSPCHGPFSAWYGLPFST